jgi:hypothetical protein
MESQNILNSSEGQDEQRAGSRDGNKPSASTKGGNFFVNWTSIASEEGLCSMKFRFDDCPDCRIECDIKPEQEWLTFEQAHHSCDWHTQLDTNSIAVERQ